MSRYGRLVAVPILLLGISSCVAGLIMGRVSTASLMPIEAGSTFTVATNELPSITDRKLAAAVGSHLEGLGFIRVESVDSARYVVGFSYDVGAGVTETRSGVSMPSHGTATHVGGGMYSVNMTGGGSSVYSNTEYPRYFSVMIVDAQATQNSDRLVVAWQGEVRSEGSISDMGRLGPTFLEQIFSNYAESVDSKAFVAPLAW